MSAYFAGTNKLAREPFDGSIEIERDQYKALLAALQQGYNIAIQDGVAVAIAPQEPAPADPADMPLADLKTVLRKQIDAAAEATRQLYITPGAGQAMTYLIKAQEAAAYLANQPGDYPILSAEVGITGADLSEVAAIVAAAHAQWTIIGASIEATRLGGKAAVTAAEDHAAAMAVLDHLAWPSA